MYPYRYFLMLKRLIKKKSYIIMLLMLPLFVVFLNMIAAIDSSALRVGVVADEENEIAAQLLADDGNIKYLSYADEEEAKRAVESELITEAWIFDDDITGTFEKFAKNEKLNPPVTQVIAEENMIHMLLREVLSSKLYAGFSKEIYKDYMQKSFDLSKEKAKQAYVESLVAVENYSLSQPLFQMGYIDGAKEQSDSFVLMPLRGILGLLLFLCAVSTSMYYLEDEECGIFIWWKSRVGFLRDFLYYFIAIVLPSLLVLACLKCGGVFTSLGRELILLFLYDVAVVLFSMILRKLFPSVKKISTLIPILILLSAVLTPVFVDIKAAGVLRNFVPLYYYLYGVHDIFWVQNLAKYITIEMFMLLIVHIFDSKVIKKNR